MYDFAIIGGGIVGLSTAYAVTQRFPGARLVLLEKEGRWGHHQTGHNSGVIHSGVYYPPGSLKASLSRAGREELVRFCRERDIEHEVCGKVIVATEPDELPRLDALYERGRENGLDVRKIGPDELREIEPHAVGLAALRVPEAGIVNFREVAVALAELLGRRGADLRLATPARSIAARADAVTIESDDAAVRARFLINCAGLQSDRIAEHLGVNSVRIVPFRGEYYGLRPERRSLVKGLIYPVPDPRFPFLGVHLTRAIDGTVHAGPNAVLSLEREGYGRRAFDLHDAIDALSYSGFWKLAARYWRAGASEMLRSFSKSLFLKSLRRLVPEIERADLEPAQAGVRAQALTHDGRLVDDFLIASGPRSIHVCNAPSPAATAALPIGRAILDRVPESFHPTR